MNSRHVLFSTMGAIGLCFSLAQAQDLTKGEKDTVYIGPLIVQPSVQEWAKSKGRELTLKRVTDSLESQLITALNATRVFQIVERKRITDIQYEAAFAAVAVNPGDKNAAQLLKLAGAKYAFLVQIDAFDDRVDKQRFDAIARVSMWRNLFFSAVVKVVDTTTGKLLPDAPSVQLNKPETVEMAGNDSNLESDQIIVELAKDMASQLSQGVVALLRPAKVLSVTRLSETNKQIQINRGTTAGFYKDDIVEVYASQEVKDEDTGEMFRNEVSVGHAQVVRSDAQQSFGIILGEDTGIAKGCVVKVVKSAHAPVIQAPLPPPNEVVTPGSGEKPLKFK